MNNIIYRKESTKVIDSFQYSNSSVNIVSEIIYQTRKEKGLLLTRTFSSYANEIIAHNRLYKLGLFRSHTKDADLEENTNWLKETIWFLLSRFAKKHI